MFKNNLKYIGPVVNEHKWRFIAIVFLYLIRPLSNTLIPIYYKKIVDLVSVAGIDKSSVGPSLFKYVTIIGILFLFTNLFMRLGNKVYFNFLSDTMHDLINLAFDKLKNHSYTFFSNNFTGSLVNKCKKFVKSYETILDVFLDNLLTPFAAFFGMLLVFFYQAPLIAFMYLVVYSAYAITVTWMAKKIRPTFIKKSAADSKVNGYLSDALVNILAIKVSSAGNREVDSFKEITDDENNIRKLAWSQYNMQQLVQSFFTISVQVVCAFIAVYFWVSGKITAGVFVLIQSYSMTLGNYFWDLGRSVLKFNDAITDMKEMTDIFDKVPDILDPVSPEKSDITNGSIQLHNVNFNYIEGADVLKDFSMAIKSGEKIGLVGHSGSGKSTITKLIMRFVDISSGSITIDGQDIRNITQDDLHNAISYIAQEPILFHRTIKENIKYSYPEATDNEIIEVAKKAHAHEFIENLPQKYETLVGERGVKLSGGERQRVAIARAMLKPAPILILDEATSSLDSVSESYIQEAFDELMKGKTTIVIAHRLSTVQKMDRIIVLDKGKIVEEGTHKELLVKGGVYADLWEHQTGGFLE